MNTENKYDGLQEIIDNVLIAMGHNPFAEGFDPKKVNLSDFQKRTGFTRSKARTLQKKAFKASHGRCGLKIPNTVLAGFEEDLDNLLRQGVTNSAVCFERLKAKGYSGGLTTIKQYISANLHLVPAPRKIAAGTESRGQRFDTAPGEAYQMDWGFTDAQDFAGNVWRMACFAMVCHHCGTSYVEFFSNARQENLFIGMIHSFLIMGIPDGVLTDNMKSVVIRRSPEGTPVWNADYDAFMRCIGFKTKLCKPYHPYTKGKVERLVRFVKQNFLVARTFTDITDLNAQALEWCASQSSRFRRPLGIVPADKHAQCCIPATQQIKQNTEVAMYLCPERKISFDGFVSYEGRRFGVPYWYTQKTCRVSREGRQIHIYSADMLTELATHAVTWGRKDSTCPDQWVYGDMPEELPSVPVTTKILKVEKPVSAGLEKFDFERMCR